MRHQWLARSRLPCHIKLDATFQRYSEALTILTTRGIRETHAYT